MLKMIGIMITDQEEEAMNEAIRQYAAAHNTRSVRGLFSSFLTDCVNGTWTPKKIAIPAGETNVHRYTRRLDTKTIQAISDLAEKRNVTKTNVILSFFTKGHHGRSKKPIIDDQVYQLRNLPPETIAKRLCLRVDTVKYILRRDQ